MIDERPVGISALLYEPAGINSNANLPVANSACTSRLKIPLVKENPLAASPTSVAVVQYTGDISETKCNKYFATNSTLKLIKDYIFIVVFIGNKRCT